MAACFAGAYLLAWRWQKGMRRQVAEEPTPQHYTDRDQLAWKKIEERIRNTEKITADELSGLQLYVNESRKGWRPNSQPSIIPMPPIRSANWTIPEVLAVVELASHDLGEMAKTYLPGGHLLTLDHAEGPNRGEVVQALTRRLAASAVLDPIRTGMRYVAAQAGLGKPFDLLKDNVFLWFYAQFVRRLGHYLVELYSGRLRIGVERYRELQVEHAETDETKPVSKDAMFVVNGDGQLAPSRAVTIAVIGQVKAGKSSLINALPQAYGGPSLM